MNLRLRPVRRSSELDMLPIINLVFLLLVFFMLMGAIVPSPPLEARPAEAFLQDQSESGGRQVIVAADGRIAFAGQIVSSLEQLSLLAGKHRPGQDELVPLKILADESADAKLVVKVLKALSSAGHEIAELVARPLAMHQ